MKQAALLVALGALLGVGVEALLLGPLAAGGLVYGAYGAALTVYLVALVLAVTAVILSDVAALRQQRLVCSIALALLTLLGLVSVALTIPPMLTSAFVAFPAPDLAFAFAPLVVLPLAALGSLLLARSHGRPHALLPLCGEQATASAGAAQPARGVLYAGRGATRFPAHSTGARCEPPCLRPGYRALPAG